MPPSHSGSDLLVVLPSSGDADALARKAVRDLHWPLNGHRAVLERLVSELVHDAVEGSAVEPSLVTLRLKRTAGTVRGEVSDRRPLPDGSGRGPGVRAGRRTTVWFELPLD
jgi:hypothetical protein